MQVDQITRPIVGIENRTPQEVFDVMSDRIRSALVSVLVSTPQVKSVVEALRPFAEISSEGVITQRTGHVTVTTSAEYFHRAAAALAFLTSKGEGE